MKLMTKEIERKIAKYGYSQGSMGFNALVLVEYFNPYGAGTWLIVGGEKTDDGDYILYGLCHIQFWEWGDILLSEMQSVGFIERETYLSSDTTVKMALKGLGLSEDTII